ncbi:hypothetical protein [Pseudomonas sp. C9-3]|uniref:hypothetical protein n=1 Tax=Pseudomonas sp. C9-3 TaxID=3078264 RepID=UPI0028EA0711|nr:hypothetical protein [Pseudomonas sp. C9-3]
MPVNTDIILRGTQNNPLESLLGYAQLGQAGMQQRAMNQQYNANVAQSEAIRGATGQDGQVDWGKALSNLAADPRGAYNAPQFNASVQQMRNSQLENTSKQYDIDTKQFDLAKKQNDWLKSGFGAMLNNPNATRQDVIKYAAGGLHQGLVTPDQLMGALQSAPEGGPELQQWLRQNYVQSLQNEAQLKAIMPQTQVINTGSGQQVLNVDPITGAPTVAGSLQNTLGPEAAAEMVRVTGPDGTDYLVPKGQLLGQGGQAPGGFAGGGGNGRYPGNSGAPMGGMPGGFQASARPGQMASAEVAAKGGAERFNGLMADADGLRNTIAGYDNAMGALDRLGTSGPGMSPVMTVNAGLEAFGLPVDADQNKNWQELHKYLENAANEAAKSAGYSGSDAGRAMFRGGQPSADAMNPAALKEAIQYVRAQSAGKLAKQQAAQQFADGNGGDLTKYSQFETRWNKAYNPDAMYMASLGDAEAAQYWKSLPEAKRKAVEKSYDQMASLGAF